jgi:alpha-tubulin suppressor-like RCC1 family protein
MNEHGALGPAADPDGGPDASDAAPPAIGTPVKIEGLGDVVQIALDDAGGCALTNDGTVSCWGWNRDGELDDSTVDDPWPTRRLPGLEVWGGHASACARGWSPSEIVCFGDNSQGQFALGSLEPLAGGFAPFAGDPSLTANAIDVAIGWGHVCIVASDSTVWCAGRDAEYELGRGFRTATDSGPCPSCESLAVRVAGPNAAAAGPLDGVREISAAWATTCAMTSGDAIYCWGFNGDSTSGGATGHAPGTMGDVPCDPPPFMSGSAPAYCTPYPTEVAGLGALEASSDGGAQP